MKATIDVPDQLQLRVKARAALQGRPGRERAIELYRRWLWKGSGRTAQESPEQWLDGWEEPCDSLPRAERAGRAAIAILAADRGRPGPR